MVLAVVCLLFTTPLHATRRPWQRLNGVSSFAVVQALQGLPGMGSGIESGDVWEDGMVNYCVEHAVCLSIDYLPVFDSDL